MTRAFVIGHPIAHSRSPLIHGFWLEQLGIGGSYERIDVAPEDLPAFLAGFRRDGFVGGNVTVPHKEAVFGLVDELSDTARRLEAVNTLSLTSDGRLRGHNTDGAGFMASLDEAVGPDWARDVGTALIVGAGGAARAVVVALLDRGISRILVVNRTRARGESLCAIDPARIAAADWRDIPGLLPGSDLLINTTSLGMVNQPPLDLDLSALPAHAVVADIVYVPRLTPLLAAAEARGLRTVGGLGMLLHQAVPGFATWFGVTPRVTPELRALVEADIEGRR